jgi:WD40 repeat protein/serine/threonine protein kinase
MSEPESKMPTATRPEITGAPARLKPHVPDHELIRLIGGGAYGEVWLAKNVVGTYRAVKVVYRDSFKDARPYEREYRGIQRFEPISRSNDGFVDILQIGRDDERGLFYYVMELADDGGERENAEDRRQNRLPPTSDAPDSSSCTLLSYFPKTLSTEIQCRGRLPFDECLPVAMSLTLALGRLHRHGLIHRDIKPSNIIFVGGIPKLADIGLVTEVGQARSFVGTEGFVPPEGPNSPQADIYSLGKVLYEMSMGKDRLDFPEPFTALGQATGSQELEELNMVILKTCAPDPRDRYQTAEEMHVDLALLQSGKSVKWKRVAEKRLAFARKAGAVVGLIAALATGGYLYQRHQTREAKRLQHLAEDLAARMQIQNAENLFERGDSSMALAHLAHALRNQPDNRVAAERIMAALMQRNFSRLVAKPMLHDAMLSLVAHRSVARFSPDSQQVVSASEDHTVRFWNAQTGEQAFPPYRHNGTLYAVDFSPDGLKVVTASGDGSACVLDTRTGTPVFPLLKHEGAVYCATFSPDGTRIATASADGKACVFDADTGELVATPFVHAGPVNSVAFSPDGQQLAAAMESGQARIWDVKSGQEKHRFRLNGPVRIVLFSPNGECLAATTFERHEIGLWQVQVWNVESGQPFTSPLLHQNRIYSLEFSPDSQRIVTATANNVARLWEITTSKELFQLRHSSLVYSAAFSPDGSQVLTASVDHTARLWDAATGAAIAEPMLHDGRVLHAEFNRDGERVLTAGWEDKTVKVWNVRLRRIERKPLQHAGWVIAAEFDASGHEAITATGGVVATANNDNHRGLRERNGISVWNVAAGMRKFRPALPPGLEAVVAQFTASGPKALIAERRLPAFSKQAWLWDCAKGTNTAEAIQHKTNINCARFSNDGRKLATGAMDGAVMIWDGAQGFALTPPLTHTGRVNSVRFSANSNLLITASDDCTAMIWNANSGARLAGPMAHDAPVWFAQFSAQGDKVMTASLDYTARIWSTNGALIAELRHSAPVEYAEFSPDGRKVVTASGDRTARLWDAATGQQLTEPLQHAELVMTALFSPDGLRIITASKDGTAQVWDVATGLKLADPFRHSGWVVSARFSADGRQAITASLDQAARIWEVPCATSPIPSWLADVAEALAGQRLNASRIPEPVASTEYAQIKERLAKSSDTSPLAHWVNQFFADQAPATALGR